VNGVENLKGISDGVAARRENVVTFSSPLHQARDFGTRLGAFGQSPKNALVDFST